MQTSIGQATAFGTGPFPTSRAESASAPNDSTSSSTNTAAITANDFLQLLVTEMKNQDPTANTDPNEYINQLVQVNSLQQLIQINQDLGGTSSTSSDSGTSSSARTPPVDAANATTQNTTTSGAQTGNLPLPSVSGAATRVARALQFPSAANSPAELRNLVQAPGSHNGALRTNISTAR